MIRILTQNFNSENLKFKYEVNVNKQGNFTTTLPKEIVTSLVKVGIRLKFNSRKTEGFFIAKSLDDLKNQVNEIGGAYSKKKLIESKIVLRYAVNTKCSYCLGKDGTIYPDGTLQTEKEGTYNWVDGTIDKFQCESIPFGFEFFVNPIKVNVWRFPNGKIRKDYEHLQDADIPESDEVLKWLNSIRGMDPGDVDSKEIDYTPEVGIFFKNLMLYVCELDKKIKSVFGKEFDLSKVSLNEIKKLNFIEKELK